MGSHCHFAWQQSSGPNVCFGSLADIHGGWRDVRFAPESGHRLSLSQCPLCAKSGRQSGWPQHYTRGGILRYFECGIPRYGNSLRTSVWGLRPEGGHSFFVRKARR